MSQVAHFTLQQYELMVESGAFSGRHHQAVEFIRGEIREMTPMSPKHAWMVDRLCAWSFATTGRDEVIVRVQSAVRISTLQSAPEPDILWLTKQDYSRQHPGPAQILLLIEVAESSLDYDRGEKAGLYAEAGIADYWVVDLVKQCVHVFRDPQASGYAYVSTYRGDDEIRPIAFPNSTLTPAILFRR